MSVFTKVKAAQFLFLPGIHSSDLIITPKKAPKTKRKRMPKFFSDLASWPKTSNLYCCNCSYRYESIPVGMPIRMVYGETMQFELTYNYCGFKCLATAISRLPDRNTKEQRFMMMKLLYERFHGKPPGEIEFAPTIEERADHGGNLNESDFKSRC
jgi:hypothetical protein